MTIEPSDSQEATRLPEVEMTLFKYAGSISMAMAEASDWIQSENIEARGGILSIDVNVPDCQVSVFFYQNLESEEEKNGDLIRDVSNAQA